MDTKVVAMVHTSYTCTVDGESCLVELKVDNSHALRRDCFVYVNKQFLFTALDTRSMKDLVINHHKEGRSVFPVLQEAMNQYAQQYYPELLL